MIRIFVEGRDAQFLEQYLVFLWGENRERWEILQTNGYTNLPLLDQKFKENTEQGGVNLIIFDADFPQNGGGCDQRKNTSRNSWIIYLFLQIYFISEQQGRR